MRNKNATIENKISLKKLSISKLNNINNIKGGDGTQSSAYKCHEQSFLRTCAPEGWK